MAPEVHDEIDEVAVRLIIEYCIHGEAVFERLADEECRYLKELFGMDMLVDELFLDDDWSP